MADEFATEAVAVAVSFPGASILDIPGQLVIKLPAIAMVAPWTPSEVKALLVCDNWPSIRPRLFVESTIRHDGAELTNFTPEIMDGEAWLSYSFTSPYSADHPALVPVIRGWLKRFEEEAK